MLKKIAALLLVPVLLAGCSAAGDVETLLRAPQLSGESAALQKALNNYLGGSATLKYPASGDFLSPFAFGDWDGDGTDEAAVLQVFAVHRDGCAVDLVGGIAARARAADVRLDQRQVELGMVMTDAAMHTRRGKALRRTDAAGN